MKKLSEIKLKKPVFKKPEFKRSELKKSDIKGVKNKGRWYICLLPALVTLLIYSIILAVKGIYPFGDNTIDYYDMAQQIAAFYYHVFDSMHGTKGWFYDFYSALGTNMAMSTSGCSSFSPFDIFFLFINRASLLKSLSVFNGIKLMCMSLTMYFYLDKTHTESPYFFKLVSSVGYAFCGFVLVLYITNQWVDIAVFFPLIMYFYDKLISEGRMKGYVITLTITLIASYYLGFMILIFIFLYTGLKMAAGYLFDVQTVETEESHTKKIRSLPDLNLSGLGIGTLISLALSSFILIPQLRQMLTSARFKNGNGEEASGIIGKYLMILKHVHGDYTTRWWTLLGLSFAASIILAGIIRFRKDRKTVFMSVSMILLMVLELFFESINLIWHFGSYIQYPIRNGFIIYFVFAYLACYYAKKLYGDAADETEKGVTDNKWYLSFLFTLAGFLVFIAFYRNHTGMPLRSVFHMTSAIMAAAVIFYMILIIRDIRSKSKKLTHIRYAAGVLAFEVLCYGFLLFGRPDYVTGYTEEPEQNGDYIYLCEQLRSEFDFEPEYLFRIKNPDESLNANYGFILARPALSNWTHMIAPGEQEGAYNWGYSVQFTRLLDSGGTVFTDALLGVRNVISTLPMDERLYELIDQAEIYARPGSDKKVTYYLYKPVYTLPFGVVLDNVDDKFDEDLNIVKAHNSVYHSMTGSDDNLAYWLVRDDNASADDVNTDTRTVNGSKTVTAQFSIGKETAVYLLGAGQDTEFANATIEVETADGKVTLNVPTIGDPDNIYYPAHFNNNAQYLGTFENEDVCVNVIMDEDKGDYFDVDIIGIDLTAMDDLCASYSKSDDYINAGKSSITFRQTAGSSDSHVLLPLTYDKGWKIMDNGRRVKAKSYAGLFTLIPIASGDNEVTMKFTPPGMTLGIIISIIALLVCIVFMILGKFRKKDTKKDPTEDITGNATENIAEDTTENIIENMTEKTSPDVSARIKNVLQSASDALRMPYMVAFLAVIIFMYLIPIITGICILVFK